MVGANNDNSQKEIHIHTNCSPSTFQPWNVVTPVWSAIFLSSILSYSSFLLLLFFVFIFSVVPRNHTNLGPTFTSYSVHLKGAEIKCFVHPRAQTSRWQSVLYKITSLLRAPVKTQKVNDRSLLSSWRLPAGSIARRHCQLPVSYTHLTLPTILRV